MIKLPNIFSRKVAYEPVKTESDELIKSIENDPITHDNVWNLKEDVNAQKLEDFWDSAVRDLKNSDK